MHATDYLVEVRKWDSTHILVITRWIDLGPGFSTDDYQWSSHAGDPKEKREPNLEGQDLKNRPQKLFDPQASGQSESASELLSRNLAYLTDERYKKVMRKSVSRRAIWCLPYNSGPSCR
ncbi:hypothetical protein N7478_004369 [Penicillium angulare]|uniref:uncharacterized protein n=1 Tax=Penicillium angulare TaxID=116970 RepID=UPI002541D75E|nr:uncharacterized protein N7478_004369 [Penicillium angulare]KAJ5278997.1 hypothetical protein N7478_004369 [Penicillium angulare]